MKIAVIMPVYNHAHLVTNAITSLMNQTYKDWELILVNDGSDDGEMLKDIVKEYRGDWRIKMITIPHQGIAKATMTGFKATDAPVVTFHGADDVSLPDRLEKAKDYFVINPSTDVFYHSLYVSFWNPVKKCLTREYRKAFPFSKERLLKEQYLPGVPFLKREVLEKKPLREETKYINDWSFYLDWAYSGFNFGYQDIGLYEYVRHKGSASQRYEEEGKRKKHLEVMKDIMKKEYGVDFEPIG